MKQEKRLFDEWMKEVNCHISAKLGIDAGDLPDLCFMDFFEDEMTPKEGAEYSLETWAEQGDIPWELI